MKTMLPILLLSCLALPLSACNGDNGSDSGSTDNGTETESNTESESEAPTDTDTLSDSASETTSATETGTQTDTGTQSVTESTTDTETESDTTTPGDGYCRYIIPFGGSFPSCREYLETWTAQERADDCADPMMGLAAAGVLDGTPCPTEELLGTCIHDQSADHSVKEYYYTGPVDVYETNCTGMLAGTWETVSTGLPDWAAPMTEALDALASDADVTVTPDDCSDDPCMEGIYNDKGWLTFTPADVTPTIGLIFWPGGNVDARSYAVVTRAIADAGVLVALPVLPPSTADQAQAIFDANTGISTWYLGGHSMGGAVTAQLANTHPEMISGGLVLFAAPGSSSADISDQDLDVLLVTATLDGLATPTKVNDGKVYLPASAIYEVIDGGNHAQFGHYGDQENDYAATITREAQQTQAVTATLSFLGIIL